MCLLLGIVRVSHFDFCPSRCAGSDGAMDNGERESTKGNDEDFVPPVARLLSKLVSIPSVNPAYVDGASEPRLGVLTPVPCSHSRVAGETRMAKELKQRLDALGAEVRRALDFRTCFFVD